MTWKFSGLLKPEIASRLEDEMEFEDGDWKAKAYIKMHFRGMQVLAFTLTRKNPHLYITGVEEEPNKVTFSLPELIHGYNGYQIKNEEEYEAALQKAREYIEEVATFSHVKEITRLDVAYNIPVENPRMLLSVPRHFKHPRMRMDKAEFKTGSMQWRGKDFTLQAYTKTKKKKGAEGKLRAEEISHLAKHLRVEVQAKTAKAVRTLYGGPINKITLEGAWKGYRTFLSELPSCSMENSEFSLIRLIALAERAGLKAPGGISIFDWSTRWQKPETVRKKRAEMAKVISTLEEVNLMEMLPESYPRRFIDVLPDNSEREMIML